MKNFLARGGEEEMSNLVRVLVTSASHHYADAQFSSSCLAAKWKKKEGGRKKCQGFLRRMKGVELRDGGTDEETGSRRHRRREVKMLIFCWSGMDGIRQEDITGKVHIRCLEDEATEVRLGGGGRGECGG